MAEMRASPVKSQALKRLADIVRLAEERGEMEILPFNPATLFPVSSTTLENLAYGNLPMAIPSQSNIPITKTGRKQEVAELAGLLPTLPAASRGVAQGANYLGDVLTQAVTRNPQATSMRALEEIGRMSPVPQITTYHGSPYLFSKFDPARVGTGEGAQAYGVGAGYTAEARPVAEGYARVLANRDVANQNRLNPHANAKRLVELAGDPKYAADDIRFVLESDPDNPQKELLSQTLSYIESGKYAEPLETLGYLYKGEIPDEILPRFLDWDKPLSQQSDEVQNVLKRRIVDVQPMDKFDMGGNARLRDNRRGQFDKTSSSPWLLEAVDESGTKTFGLTQKDVDRMFGAKDAKDLTGEQIYARLTQEMGSQQAASDYLNSLGVRGIRYADQVSRGKGQGTSNFVNFRPEDYQIQEINDQPIADFVRSGRLQVAPDDPLAQFLSGR